MGLCQVLRGALRTHPSAARASPPVESASSSRRRQRLQSVSSGRPVGVGQRHLMAAGSRRTRAPGSGRCGRSHVVWRAIPSYDGVLPRSWRSIGHREQISGWLKREFPADEGLRVSHEAIYRSLFVQARGVLKKELIGHLRARRRMRYPKGGTTAKSAARTDRRCDFHPRTPCRSRGPRRSRPLGRRPALG